MEKERNREPAAAVANNGQTVTGRAKCPVAHGARGRRNRDWWPDAAGHLGSSPELQLVRPHGRRVRLCQGV